MATEWKPKMLNDTYYLFAGDFYYPEGGMNDLKGVQTDIEMIFFHIKEKGYDWWQVCQGTEILVSGSRRYGRNGAEELYITDEQYRKYL